MRSARWPSFCRPRSSESLTWRPGIGRAARRDELADEVAQRVDLEHAGAVAAAQVAVVGVLDAVLADDRALAHAAEALLLELVGRDLADVAQQLGGELVPSGSGAGRRVRDDARVGLPCAPRG